MNDSVDITKDLSVVRATIADHARLIAVSKTKPISAVQEAYNAGQRLFGENHAQEMRGKHEVLPKDIEWHMIGHLQTNKVKYIASFVDLVHSIDSEELLRVVNKEAAKHGRVIDCLLQFHIAEEKTKFGLTEEEAKALLENDECGMLKNIRIVGVMGMATNTPDQDEVRKEFRHLKQIFDHLKAMYFTSDASFKEISMGMSHDYKIAVEEGSTLVRVGQGIFGIRDYGIKGNE